MSVLIPFSNRFGAAANGWEEGLDSGKQAVVARIASRRREWTPDDTGVLPCQHGHCEYPTKAT